LGLEETKLQVVEARLYFLAMGMGHEDECTKKGVGGFRNFWRKMIWMNVIREKR
jgi:hypothetical protein